MNSFLRVVSNRLINFILTIVVATLPFFICIVVDAGYGWADGHSLSPLRADECFLALGVSMMLCTLIIEIGSFFPPKISGIFNYVSLFPAFFMSLYAMTDPYGSPYDFFQGMCVLGIAFYPYAYVIIRKYLKESFWTILSPLFCFVGFLLVGLVITLIFQNVSMFVIFKLPFWIALAIVLGTLGFLIWKGFDIFCTEFTIGLSKLLPNLGPSNKPEDKGDDESSDTNAKLAREIKNFNGSDGIDIVDVEVSSYGRTKSVKITVRVPSYNNPSDTARGLSNIKWYVNHQAAPSVGVYEDCDIHFERY